MRASLNHRVPTHASNVMIRILANTV